MPSTRRDNRVRRKPCGSAVGHRTRYGIGRTKVWKCPGETETETTECRPSVAGTRVVRTMGTYLVCSVWTANAERVTGEPCTVDSRRSVNYSVRVGVASIPLTFGHGLTWIFRRFFYYFCLFFGNPSNAHTKAHTTNNKTRTMRGDAVSLTRTVRTIRRRRMITDRSTDDAPPVPPCQYHGRDGTQYHRAPPRRPTRKHVLLFRSAASALARSLIVSAVRAYLPTRRSTPTYAYVAPRDRRASHMQWSQVFRWPVLSNRFFFNDRIGVGGGSGLDSFLPWGGQIWLSIISQAFSIFTHYTWQYEYGVILSISFSTRGGGGDNGR